MRFVCGPDGFKLPDIGDAERVILYGQAQVEGQRCAGKAVKDKFFRERFQCSTRAWDLLSIALGVITADFAVSRERSPDGWTREFELDIAVSDAQFWVGQVESLVGALSFLTTDRWTLRFHKGGYKPTRPKKKVRPAEDCVVLLSGGLDSLVGAIDLVAAGYSPLAVSQTVRGDAGKQREFAARIGGGLKHLQLNHNANLNKDNPEKSQRARSLIFLAFGVLAATVLQRYHDGDQVPLYVCENGFIAINPPLTGGRIGSLSTRTTHPEFLGRLQSILDAGELRVKVVNPYYAKTKGEMLRECADQSLLKAEAIQSTSCSRFQRFNYLQCGRCVPCQVRRAAFLAWGGIVDSTDYIYREIGCRDKDHSGFDDVRSVAVALADFQDMGADPWFRYALASPFIRNREELRNMLKRGMAELGSLHKNHGLV